MNKPLKIRLIILSLSVLVITGAASDPDIHSWTPHDSSGRAPLVQSYPDN